MQRRRIKQASVLVRKGYPDMIVPSESAEQQNLFMWASTVRELQLMYAVPNGGSRRPIEAKIMKGEGVKAGVPDIHLPIGKCGYSTLYIELKRKAFALPETGAAKWGTISSSQLSWLRSLNDYGHWAVVCRGAEHAKQTVKAYMGNNLVELYRLNEWWGALSAERLRKVTKDKSITAKRRKG